MNLNYLNSFKKFGKAETSLKSMQQIKSVQQKSVTEANVDIDAINDRLGKGDKDAVQELDKQRISYTLTESDSGYTVKYNYKGTNYTINYYAPVESPVDSEPVTSPDEPAKDEPVFDFTGVNKDAKAEDLYNKDNIPKEKQLMMLLGQKGNVDSGAWDDVFKEIDKMKPQLLEYIKTRMESKGLTYNAETAERYLNMFITAAVKHAPVDGTKVMYSIKDIQVKNDPTIEDLIDYIKARIDKEMGDVSENSTANYNEVYKEPFKAGKEYTQDYDLVNIADYFLTDEEKEMKFVMKVVRSEESSYATSDIDQLEKYIDTYAKHMKKVLIATYPKLSENDIDNIISFSKYIFKTVYEYPKNEAGYYSIDDTLKSFELRCLEQAEKRLA